MSTFRANTAPTKESIVNNITRDSSVQACIFDLIDNSIDAWHGALLESDPTREKKFGVLQDFTGLKVKVVINEEKVSVSDNGPGLDPSSVEISALRFGARSSKSSGIGLFGVGLNRAIFKIGGVGFINSKTKTEQTLLEIDVSNYTNSDDDWSITALSEFYSGPSGFSITIEKPNSQALRYLRREKNISETKIQSSEIYAYFLSRGMKLFINEEEIFESFIDLRDDSPFPLITDFVRLDNDAQIKILAGQHSKHRFSAEKRKTGHTNKGLTSDYGWNVYCNDRAILLKNKEKKLDGIKYGTMSTMALQGPFSFIRTNQNFFLLIPAKQILLILMKPMKRR